MTTIISVCSICNKVYGTKDGKGKSGISHGYCSDCKKIAYAEMMEMLENELHNRNIQ